MQRSPPEGEHVWVGVLTSCLPEEVARDGLFAQRLAGLLEHGPEPGPDTRALLVQRWSPQSQYIRGDDLCDAVLKTWGTAAHTPDFLQPRAARGGCSPTRGMTRARRSGWWSTCCWRPGAARRPGEQSWFTGRTAEVDQVVAWVRSGQPGLHVITGSAGTGKTAIAGRVVSLSNPAERERLLAEGRPIGHADPGERSVAAHVHARGLTADRAADLIAGQLVRAGVLAAQPDRRNAAELVGQVQRAAEEGAAPPVIVMDGLDEARGQAFPIAEELLLRLAPYATVIMSTRELRRGETEPSLLDVLTAGTAELDLDDPAAQAARPGGHARLHRRAAGRGGPGDGCGRGGRPPGRGDVDDRGQPVPAGPAGHRPAARLAGRHLPAGLAGPGEPFDPGRVRRRPGARAAGRWPPGSRRGRCWPR